MKKWKRVLAVLLCLMCVQVPAVSEQSAVQVEAAAVKKGLKKEGGKYYYYENNKRVANAWRNVSKTVNGKKVTYRYYFGKDGAAYAGKKAAPKLAKISGAYYAFDSMGRMLKGKTYVISGAYRKFDNNGRMTGIIKQGSNYYYYRGTKKSVNRFETVTFRNSAGKKYTRRYYFGKNGAAYKGKKDYTGASVPLVKKIGSYWYGFDTSARMVTGTYVVNDKFYLFSSKNGRLDKTKTNKLRAASKYQANAKTLRSLMGKPQKTDVLDSCYGDGKDLLLYYSHCIVNLYRDKKGKEIVLSVMPR